MQRIERSDSERPQKDPERLLREAECSVCFMSEDEPDEGAIREQFCIYGEIVRYSAIPSGRVFIRFKTPESAKKALESVSYCERVKPRIDGNFKNFKGKENYDGNNSPNNTRGYDSNESYKSGYNAQQRYSTGWESNGNHVMGRNFRNKVNSPSHIYSSGPDTEVGSNYGSAVDVVIGNLPYNSDAAMIEEITADMRPLCIGDVLTTGADKYILYCHVLVAGDQANLFVSNLDKTIYRDKKLVVALASDLMSEVT